MGDGTLFRLRKTLDSEKLIVLFRDQPVCLFYFINRFS